MQHEVIENIKVQAGTTHRLGIRVSTSPVESGKAGAFALAEAFLTVGSTVHNLVTDGLVVPEMVEYCRPDASTALEASVTATPMYSAAGGPSSENIYIVTVDSTVGYSANEFVRGKGKGTGEGHVHEILEVTNGTTLELHSSSANFDIEDGDTIERVDGSGVYVGYIDLDVSDYLSATDPTGELRLVLTAEASGADPVFDSGAQVVITKTFELDLGGRGYRAG